MGAACDESRNRRGRKTLRHFKSEFGSELTFGFETGPGSAPNSLRDLLARRNRLRNSRSRPINEALRTLASPHAVIRWHACSLLGDRALGKTAGKLILPALAARLTDPHPIVRRLAVLSLSYWKSAAKPHRPAIAALAQDPDETVRKIVAHVLQ